MDSIIFDVDGTLWDSTDSVARSWNLAIQENSSLDLTITENALQQVFGKTMTEIADTLFSRLPEKERMKLLEVCFQYENRYLETIPENCLTGLPIRWLRFPDSIRFSLSATVSRAILKCCCAPVLWNRL